MNVLILKHFNKAIATVNPIPYKEMNEAAFLSGYLVHPNLCNLEVYNWIKSQKVNHNATFYKKWNSVITKDRFELFIDQIRHYASTYGTNYTGEVYVPEVDVEVPDFKDFKVIQPITKEEAISRCEKMLFSGIALKQDTIEDMLSILDWLNHTIDVSKVRNKEAKMIIYEQTGSLPTDAVEMVRYLVYLATENTLLIKDAATIEAIKSNTKLAIHFLVFQFGYEKLSSVFFRFKPLFLAFRNSEGNKVCINKLRRLANKNHIPFKAGYFEKLLSDKTYSMRELFDNIDKISNFKKISILQTISVRMKNLENRAFVIRNQKLFIKEGRVKILSYPMQNLYNTIYANLVWSLSKKSCAIKLPKGVNLTLPTSEKSFIGNYPLGTSFDFADSDNIVGINWRASEGADDLDLKLIDVDGNQYGWNAAFKNSNNSIVYSGDMTDANPEATELFYTSKGFNPAIVKVNLYNGNPKSKFKFFIAKEKIISIKRDYMVDPNNILFTVDCEMDSQEKSLGVITDNKFILAQFRTGRGVVAKNSVTDLYTEYALKTLDCYVSLEKLLTDAGFTITDTNPVIDLSNLSKDTLIDLLSK